MKNLLKQHKFFTLLTWNDMSHNPPSLRFSTSLSFSSKLALFLHCAYIQNRKGKIRMNINHHYHFLLMGFTPYKATQPLLGMELQKKRKIIWSKSE